MKKIINIHMTMNKNFINLSFNQLKYNSNALDMRNHQVEAFYILTNNFFYPNRAL